MGQNRNHSCLYLRDVVEDFLLKAWTFQFSLILALGEGRRAGVVGGAGFAFGRLWIQTFAPVSKSCVDLVKLLPPHPPL